MIQFLNTLKTRNSILYYYGWSCFIASICCAVLISSTTTEVLGINAWIKPFKFFLSAGIFSWTMGWYMVYLNEKKKVNWYSWIVVIVFAFETIYIAIQAGRGELSHFNLSSKFYGFMFSLMGLAITFMTLWTAYIGYLFFKKPILNKPRSYIWGIRFGIIIFVIFALEGGMMGQFLSHTVGAPDGGKGLPLLNWSTTFGDLRVAHFMGMHALQIIPFVAYYLLKKVSWTIAFSIIYFGLTVLVLVKALMALPLF